MQNQAELKTEIDALWRRIATACQRNGDPFRTPALGTIGLWGMPQVRTVVLRAVMSKERALVLHTDSASRKCTEIADNPKVSLCLWDPKARLQVRLLGDATVTVSTDTPLWETLGQSGQKIYGVSPTPGTPINGPKAFRYGTEFRFSTVRCVVNEVDALWLSRPKHRRLRAHWNDDEWAASWVVP